MKQEKPVSVPEEQKVPSESASPAAGARGLQVSHCCLLLSGQLRAGSSLLPLCVCSPGQVW